MSKEQAKQEAQRIIDSVKIICAKHVGVSKDNISSRLTNKLALDKVQSNIDLLNELLESYKLTDLLYRKQNLKQIKEQIELM